MACKPRQSCTRCRGKTRAGNDCRRKTCKFAPYCYQHSPVVVGNGAFGRGLIARRDIKANEAIATFTHCPRALTDPDNFHTFKTRGYYYDGSNVRCCIAGMANAHRSGHPGPPKNAKIKASGWIWSTKPIRAGEEVIVTYGGNFWRRYDRALLDRPTSRRPTSRRRKKK